jgi:hypothetical protein
MEFIIKVETGNKGLGISHHERIVMLGSCFVDNIGAKLVDAGFDCTVNPFGTLYNPVSILNALCNRDDEFLRWTQKNDEISDDEIDADIYILTFGTSWVYRLKQTGHIVANCKKAPENLFQREMVGVEQIAADYGEFIAKKIVPQGKKIVFTVSPIRHKRDGMHENQLSKAVLLLAVDKLCKNYPGNCFYFPAYEIMMDELRDYRFYADDMIHPSAKAVDYIWERFGETYFNKETQRYRNEFESLSKTLSHKPFNPESEEYKQLISTTKDKLNELKYAVRNK